LEEIPSEKSLPEISAQPTKNNRQAQNFSMLQDDQGHKVITIRHDEKPLDIEKKRKLGHKTELSKYQSTVREQPESYVHIDDYLTQTIDTRKVNVKHFKNNILKFQNKYKLNLLPANKKAFRN